jgi:DHA1 family bicyclomycin/chloramphenicol resistance-like MFS transporter
MTSGSPPPAGLGQREFVALVAALMAVNVLGVDLMLPALPTITRDLGVTQVNAQQWIVGVYLLGFGLGQIVYGPLSDRLGRRPVLLVTLGGYVLASLLVANASSYAALLSFRALQGAMSASTRVLSVALVRDSYSGSRMARISSLAQMIFYLVPMLAPSLGQVLLEFGTWRFIFYMLGCFAATVLAWALVRLPETLPEPLRRPISASSLANAYRLALTERSSIGYALAGAFTFCCVVAFISSAQQIFVETFGTRDGFGILFGLCALALGLSSFANSWLVEKHGTRVLSQLALIAFTLLSALHLIAAAWTGHSLWTFMIFQGLSLMCIGLCGPNFGAMAMEPVGHIAGVASSVQNSVTVLLGVAIGASIGQLYDGTVVPLAAGYLVIGMAALGTVYLVEGRRLFRR